MGNSQFLTIRGSQTRPHMSLDDAMKNLAEAQKILQEAQNDLANVKSMKTEISTLGEESENFSAENLVKVISVLEERLKRLEQHEYAALAEQQRHREVYDRVITQLLCGGVAGAVARTVVAPLDRVKILMQTQYLSEAGQNKYRNIPQTIKTIVEEQGFTKLWRGNVTNIVRVAPYSATQFTSYDLFKTFILDFNNRNEDTKSKTLTVPQRLTAGAVAGTVATTITHPLDLIRLRLNVQPELKGAFDAFNSILIEGGPMALFKGYTPTVLSLAPFIAINFAVFDIMKEAVYPDDKVKKSQVVNLMLGGGAGIIAQSICYPLDTVRRRMQMKGKNYANTLDAFRTIFRVEGMSGFYKGMVPNAVKVVPNNAIRFMVFEKLKEVLDAHNSKPTAGSR